MKGFDDLDGAWQRALAQAWRAHVLGNIGVGAVLTDRGGTIIAEGERIHSHLLWFGLAGHFLGYNTVYMWMWRLREEILDVLEILSGNRQNYAMFKPGGVRRDINAFSILAR